VFRVFEPGQVGAGTCGCRNGRAKGYEESFHGSAC
jgi:hypothetical protein